MEDSAARTDRWQTNSIADGGGRVGASAGKPEETAVGETSSIGRATTRRK